LGAGLVVRIVFPRLTGLIRRPQLRSANRTLLRAIPFAGLCFAIGCGNTSSSQPAAKVFSNASLQGNYTYALSGSYFNSMSGNGPYQEAGTFVADGNGNITSGIDDFVQNSALSSGQLTGSYAIANDGTGKMTLNLARGKIHLAITLISGSALYLIEFDSFATGAGVVRQQSTAAFSAVPSGTFIFHLHSSHANNAVLGSVSSVGSMTVKDGAIDGQEDVVRAGVPGSSGITGSMTAPSTNGRGTAVFTDDAGIQSSYIYYVIDFSTLKFLETDPGPLGSGQADAQTGGPFSDASLNNGFAFSCAGDTLTSRFGVNGAGVFVSDGNGNIVSGTYDSVQDGSPTSNVALSGMYNVESNGRTTIALNPKGLSPIPVIAWMANSSKAYFLVNTPNLAEDGRLEQQQNSPFSAASLNGTLAFYMYGYFTQTLLSIDRVGVLDFDGSSTVTFTNYFANHDGSTAQNGPVAGNYAVSPNGRVVAFSVGAANTQVIYLVSDSSGYIILGASGTEVAGYIGQQTPP
jgi:hypothetical protein